jgi:hypothetical protein
MADSQALDVIVAAAKQARDPVQHAGLVFHPGYQCVFHPLPSLY